MKQGEVIGYVGSTGLATGPHVCFRFWMNNKQVNHLALKFPPAKPLAEEYMPEFEKIRDRYMADLASVDFPEIVKEETPKEELAVAGNP